MKKMMLLLLVLALLTSATGLGELRRGDKGVEVTYLQTLLFESGFLFDTPDGAFGKKTEQAVKDYQKFAGLKADGVVTDELLARLEETWRGLMGEIYGEDVEGAEKIGNCSLWMDNDASGQAAYCERHAALFRQASEQLQFGSDADIAACRQQYIGEIMALYSQWADMVPEEERGPIKASRVMFLAAADMQFKAADEYFRRENGAQTSFAAELAMEQFLRGNLSWLCQLVSSLSGVGEN